MLVSARSARPIMTFAIGPPYKAPVYLAVYSPGVELGLAS